MINKIKELHANCTGELCETALMAALGVTVMVCMWLSLAQL
jgi:hypothetical protein